MEAAIEPLNAAAEAITAELGGMTLSSEPRVQPRRRYRSRQAPAFLQAANLPFRCDLCDRSFGSHHALADHKRQSLAHAAERLQTEANRPDPKSTLIMDEHNDVPAPWSTTTPAERERLLRLLEMRVHPVHELAAHHYEVTDNRDLYKAYSNCTKCRGNQKKVERKPCLYHNGPRILQIVNGERETVYACCRRTGKGCVLNAQHNFVLSPNVDIRNIEGSLATPEALPDKPKYRAVTFDCEMVGHLARNRQGGFEREKSEVISLSAVDMLSGKVLINTLVQPPRGGQIHWRKRFTGMDPQKLADADAAGRVLPSWQAARSLLWDYIDSSTILVGHALHHDLKCLRMVHTRVVDSEILARDAVFGFNIHRQWSLKNLCMNQLGIAIQCAYKPHDALEDTYATREVVMSMLQGLKLTKKELMMQN